MMDRMNELVARKKIDMRWRAYERDIVRVFVPGVPDDDVRGTVNGCRRERGGDGGRVDVSGTLSARRSLGKLSGDEIELW